jgi:DNA-binding CsgD family transcriptional regulator
LLETVREFGLEQLAASGEERTVRLAHADYAIALAERADRDATSGVFRPWFNRLAAEQGNLRTALAWLEHAGEVERTLQLAGALWPLWYAQGPYHEERALLERVLTAGSDAPFHVRGRAQWGAGILALTQGDVDEAHRHFAAATAQARALGYTLALSGGLLSLGWIAIHRGDFECALEHQRESLALAHESAGRGGAVGLVAQVLGDLGSSAFAQGHLDQAEAVFQEALDRRRLTNQSWGVALSHVGLGFVFASRGAHQQALASLTEGLVQANDNGDRRLTALALAGVAIVAVAWGKPRTAARLFGAVDRPEASGLPIEPAYRSAKDRAIAACRTAMGERAFAAAWAEGRSLGPDAAIAEAAALAASPDLADVRPPSKLSPREVDVLRLIVEGRTDREIGEALFISRRTVMTHVSNILAKLGVESRTAAAAHAVRDNLL